jgi:hypothetical protein
MAEVNLSQGDQSGTVPVRLYNQDGKFEREIRLNPEFATRIINFNGWTYESVPDDEQNNVKSAWRATQEHPESALSGVVDDD